MQVPLVMTIIGPDRTGLVESVARVVAEHGGNWLESRMCRLGGEFAGILRIELPVEKRQPLLLRHREEKFVQAGFVPFAQRTHDTFHAVTQFH